MDEHQARVIFKAGRIDCVLGEHQEGYARATGLAVDFLARDLTGWNAGPGWRQRRSTTRANNVYYSETQRLQHLAAALCYGIVDVASDLGHDARLVAGSAFHYDAAKFAELRMPKSVRDTTLQGMARNLHIRR